MKRLYRHRRTYHTLSVDMVNFMA
ncbi:hypothetical protein CEXT_742251, partial [Caerostris extrusa]